MSTDPIAPAATRHDLPATPLMLSDVPLDAPRMRLGALVWFVGGGPQQRPFASVLVPCKKCKHPHRYPWRLDWPVSADVASHQISHCPRDPHPVWLALDPATLAESETTLTEARAAFVSWREKRDRRRAEREVAVPPPPPVMSEPAVAPEQPPPVAPPPPIPATASTAPASSAPLSRRVRQPPPL